MEVTVRAYRPEDLPALAAIWNVVVADGEAFPQLDLLTPETAAEFFAAQDYTAVAELDGRVEQEIHSPDQTCGFAGYTPETSEDTVLKIPYPYDSIYPIWIKMQVDRVNGEMQKYNDGAILCDEKLDAYRRTLVRTTDSPPCKVKYF